MAAKFEKLLISPDFPINFRKVTKFHRIISNALKVIDKNLWGVPKDPPGLNRVKESTKLLSWDIKNYYPNCSTELCMRAVKRILDERGTNLPQNSKNCILEALSITMSSYNGQFLGSYLLRLMVQLLGDRSRQVSGTFLGQFI